MLTVVIPVLSILIITGLTSYILLFLNQKFKETETNIEEKLAEDINKLLPQTQCGQCSFPGCMPYALAISKNEADINRCPPGGQDTINDLANLLNLEPKPLADDISPAPKQEMVAVINEPECIGCVLCIKACPVDAIIGAPKQMHTVVADLCTGCDLCIAPCPMDCITMEPKPEKAKFLITPAPEVQS